MPENKDLMIKKHSGMIQNRVGNMTLTQRKLINFLIYIAQASGDQKTYKTTISDVKKICNLTSTENISVKEQLKDLTKITIEFNYLDKDKYNIWGVSTLLASALVTPNLGTIEFEFSNLLKNKILNPSMYAPINIILVAGLKCSYAVILYEFLRDYLTSPAIPMLTIEALRNLLGIDDNKYRAFPDFKRNVLMPATEEINLKTDVTCHYELIKEKGIRNRYSHIRFFVSKKSGNMTYEKKEGMEKESSNPNMELFENLNNQVDGNSVKIPEDILSVLPESQKTETISGILKQYLEKGNEYIVSNIKYSLKNAKDNFPAYLRQALEKDYANHDREVETKTKAKEEKARKKKVEAEVKTKTDRSKIEKMLELIKRLSETERENLKERAITIIKAESPGNEFALSELLVGLKMAQLYTNDHEAREYSTSDQD